jgi:hypothetical protein
MGMNTRANAPPAAAEAIRRAHAEMRPTQHEACEVHSR